MGCPDWMRIFPAFLWTVGTVPEGIPILLLVPYHTGSYELKEIFYKGTVLLKHFLVPVRYGTGTSHVQIIFL